MQEVARYLSRKCRHFRVCQKLLLKTSLRVFPTCRPDTRTCRRHHAVSGFFLCVVFCVVLSIADMSIRAVEMLSFELEGAYVTHIPYVCFYTRTWVLAGKISVGCRRHKRPRHLKSCVGDTDPSGQNRSNILYVADMLATFPTKPAIHHDCHVLLHFACLFLHPSS